VPPRRPPEDLLPQREPVEAPPQPARTAETVTADAENTSTAASESAAGDGAGGESSGGSDGTSAQGDGTTPDSGGDADGAGDEGDAAKAEEEAKAAKAEEEAKAAKQARRDELSQEKGKSTAKNRSEADTVLQAEDEGLLKGKPRRPDLKAGEPDHDFALEGENGKVVGYAEIKTPVSPRLNPIANQASDIAGKIQLYPPDGNLQIIVDLKNLDPADKLTFLDALKANGLDVSKVTILNK
jgi:hypothetical protein